MSDPMDTLYNPYMTYHYDKVSCMQGAFVAHWVFAYAVMLTGIGAFVSRVVPAFKWTHVWFGRAYIISMLWATATSLIIHNTGLPPATLISFVWVMGGLTIGWVLIKFHQARIERQAIRNVARDISVNGLGSHDLAARIQQEKGRIADSKTFVERFFSIKALHGIIMFVSWINVAGRAFATNLSKSDRACYTYPVYKPLDLPEIPDGSSVNASSLTLVPTHDPHYERTPWAKLGLVGWAVVMLIAPLAGAAVIGAVWSWLAVWRMKAKQHAATVADNAAGLAGVAGFIAK